MADGLPYNGWPAFIRHERDKHYYRAQKKVCWRRPSSAWVARSILSRAASPTTQKSTDQRSKTIGSPACPYAIVATQCSTRGSKRQTGGTNIWLKLQMGPLI